MLEVLTCHPYLCACGQQNRPLNAQSVADALQKYNLKKTAVQKALDNLADTSKISFKEYGKQRIYLARQDQFQIPNTEELEKMKQMNDALQEELTAEKQAVAELESGAAKQAFLTAPRFFVVRFENVRLCRVFGKEASTLYANGWRRDSMYGVEYDWRANCREKHEADRKGDGYAGPRVGNIYIFTCTGLLRRIILLILVAAMYV